MVIKDLGLTEKILYGRNRAERKKEEAGRVVGAGEIDGGEGGWSDREEKF